MKIFVLYRKHSDHARAVETFAHDFDAQTSGSIELVDMDTRAGDEKAQLYGIMNFPAVVAVQDNGQMLKTWSDPLLPRIQEVAAYID